MVDKRHVESMKRAFRKGERVELIEMKDEPQAPPPHTKGTVTGVDDMGDILVNWDNGSTLKLVYGIDAFVTLL
jgi:hypothetical protein